ncbi:MAG: radical SAM protein [Candidatus Hydrogenedentes bacterium]|nr:radical SAM protein [Candidatus Hydrogenedentota bacterium]
MSYVFGPVPSRRLGRSLGVDLVPFKMCTYDCIYCQLGCTTDKSLERQPFVPADKVLEEIKEKIALKPDYITLSGSGEPTLYTGIGDIIEGIRAFTDIPIALITNGSLLWKKEVRQAIANAHLIIPSLDAGNTLMFNAVNRNHPDISFEQMLDGLIALRDDFTGTIWLEVFILSGYTADIAEVKQMAACAKRIRPDRIQLNTVTRPPAEEFAMTVNQAQLEEMCQYFEPEAEVIADFREVHNQTDFTTTRDAVEEMLQRRPCSIDDITTGLHIHRHEALKHLQELLADKRIEMVRTVNRIFYRTC